MKDPKETKNSETVEVSLVNISATDCVVEYTGDFYRLPLTADFQPSYLPFPVSAELVNSESRLPDLHEMVRQVMVTPLEAIRALWANNFDPRSDIKKMIGELYLAGKLPIGENQNGD